MLIINPKTVPAGEDIDNLEQSLETATEHLKHVKQAGLDRRDIECETLQAAADDALNFIHDFCVRAKPVTD